MLNARSKVALPVGKDPAEWTDEELYAYANQRGRLARFFRELWHNPQLIAGLALLVGFGVVGLAEVSYRGYSVASLTLNFQWAQAGSPPGPSLAHPFGVFNGYGFDGFAAILEATPWDLAIVGTILIVAVAVGVLLGTYAGFAGGAVDWVVLTLTDLLLAVPPFFLVVVLYIGVAQLLPGPLWNLPTFLALFALVLWPYYARPVRARAERVSKEPYVEASRAAGASRARLLTRHVLPNSLYPVFAQIPIDVYNIFFVLTVFPYLGCVSLRNGGASGYSWLTPFPTIPFPEWGTILAIGACYGWQPIADLNSWWMYAFPAAVIVLFGVALALTCDGMEKLLHGRVTGS